jgi:hypothetical protein
MADIYLDTIIQRINTFHSDDIETNAQVLLNQIQTIRLPPDESHQQEEDVENALQE